MFAKIFNAACQCYPAGKRNGFWLRLRFFKHAIQHYQTVRSFVNNIESLGYERLFDHEIPVLGAVEWPYLHKDWTVSQRFSVIQRHYEIIKNLPTFLDVADGNPKELLDLSDYSPNTKIILDKAQWFVREGEIVLNLFKDDLRIMTIAFTLSDLNKELVMYVGAVQGLHADEHSLDRFKALTKDLEGIRPRDFLMEVLRMLASNIGVKKILGIADAYRHHRHAYFCNYHAKMLKTSYDEIWLEQGGSEYGEEFYELSLEKARRDLAEVSANKRAMYRRRYEMLDVLKHNMAELFGNKGAVPVRTATNVVEVLKKTEKKTSMREVSLESV